MIRDTPSRCRDASSRTPHLNLKEPDTAYFEAMNHTSCRHAHPVAIQVHIASSVTHPQNQPRSRARAPSQTENSSSPPAISPTLGRDKSSGINAIHLTLAGIQAPLQLSTTRLGDDLSHGVQGHLHLAPRQLHRIRQLATQHLHHLGAGPCAHRQLTTLRAPRAMSRGLCGDQANLSSQPPSSSSSHSTFTLASQVTSHAACPAIPLRTSSLRASPSATSLSSSMLSSQPVLSSAHAIYRPPQRCAPR